MPSYAEVFRTKGYLLVFLVSSLSAWGDYVARITMAAVVFERTGSDLAAAGTFAVSMVPAIFGRSLLAPLADRLPYKVVLLGAHLVRAALVAVLIWAVGDSAPIGLLLVLLFTLELFGGPAAAATQILMTDVFPDRRVFVRAYGLMTLVEQLNQCLGLAIGGVLVAVVGATRGLWFDLATFALAVIVTALVVRTRPVSGRPSAGIVGFVRDLGVGTAYLVRHRVLRSLLMLSMLATWAMAAPEAVALPYAEAVTGSARLGGVLMAAPMLGAVVGVLVVGRWQPERANSRIIALALLMPVPLLLTAFTPPLPVAGLLWFTCGMLQAFMLPLQSTFSLVVAEHLRGRVFGLGGAVSVATSGVAFLVAGWVSQHTNPAAAVVILAICSLGGIVLLAARWPRAELSRAVDAAYNS
jgi:MFS family permease